MASAPVNPYADNPPSYEFAVDPQNNASKFGMQYQSQEPPLPSESSYYVSQPTPTGMGYPPSVAAVQPAKIILGHRPQTVQCVSCHERVLTRVQYESSGLTWVIALIICLLGGFLGCCFIPFCVSSCQDALHTCPVCQYRIGRHTPV